MLERINVKVNPLLQARVTLVLGVLFVCKDLLVYKKFYEFKIYLFMVLRFGLCFKNVTSFSAFKHKIEM